MSPNVRVGSGDAALDIFSHLFCGNKGGVYNGSVRILISIIALFIAGATFLQLRGLWFKRAELAERLETASAKASILAEENSVLREEIRYFSETENLAREAKARLNYASPGEKVIIVVPKKEE